MSFKSKELREQRAALAKQMQEMVLTARNEGRPLNTEEQEKFDRLDTEQQRCQTEAEGYERLERFEDTQLKELRSPEKRPTEVRPMGMHRRNDESQALRGWLLRGTGQQTEEMRQAAARTGIDLNTAFNLELSRNMEKRALSKADTAGEELLPLGTLVGQIEIALRNFSTIRQVARVIRTSDGNKISVPYMDDTANVGAIIADNVADTYADPVFTNKELSSFTYTSRICLVPWSLIRDSAFNIEQFLGEALGQRVTAATEAHFLTGSGSGQPEGVITGSSLGVTAASATAVTVDELLDLYYSVPAYYRNNPSSAFILSAAAAKAARKLVDGNGRPLWEQNLQVGAPDVLFGRPVYVDNTMTGSLAANAKIALYGDFSYYWIRDVGSVQLLQSDQRFFEYRQTAFVCLSAHDAKVMNSSAIKHLRLAAA